jgi:hypothetical protein
MTLAGCGSAPPDQSREQVASNQVLAQTPINQGHNKTPTSQDHGRASITQTRGQPATSQFIGSSPSVQSSEFERASGRLFIILPIQDDGFFIKMSLHHIWVTNPDPEPAGAGQIDHEYSGLHGKLQRLIRNKQSELYQTALLEDGRTIYCRCDQGAVPNEYSWSYFPDELSELRKKIGAHVWLKRNCLPADGPVIGGKEVTNLQELRIIAARMRPVEDYEYDRPLELTVVTADGSFGHLPYDAAFYLWYDPSINWTTAIRKAVRQRAVSTGMTAEQLRLAWGEPEKIVTTTQNGHLMEEWLYSDDQSANLQSGRVIGATISWSGP